MRVWLTTCLLLLGWISPLGAQTFGVIQRGILAEENQQQLPLQILVNAGRLLDYINNNFIDQVTPRGTPAAYASATAMCAAVSCTVSTSPKYIWTKGGVLTLTSANSIPEFCYGGGGTLIGVCLESAVTSVALQTNAFQNVAWTKTGLAAVDNSVADPAGATGASSLTEDTSTGTHSASQSITKAASALGYVTCVFIKGGLGNRNVGITVTDGAGNGAQAAWTANYGDAIVVPVTPLGTGFTNVSAVSRKTGIWGGVRTCLIYTTNTATTLQVTFGLVRGTAFSYLGDGTGNLTAWDGESVTNAVSGQQTATAPSSPVPTTTTAVTRIRDQVPMLLPSGLQGKLAYSFFINATLPAAANGLAVSYVSLNDSTNTHRISLLQQTPANSSAFSMQAIDATTLNVTMAGPLNLFGQQFGIAAIAQAGNWWTENTGQSIATSTSSVYPSTPLTTLRLGDLNTANTASGNIGLLQVALFPTALPITTAQALLFAAPPFNPNTVTAPNYFTQPMISDVLPTNATVFQVGGMPANNSVAGTAYAAFPLTVALNANVANANVSTATDVSFAWLFSMVRCNLCAGVGPFGLAPSGYSSPAIRTSTGAATAMSFTAYAKSQAVIMIDAMYALGYPDHAGGPCPAGLTYCGYADLANAVGMADSDLIPYATARASPDAVFTIQYTLGASSWMTTVDQVILPQAKIGPFATPPATQAIYGIACDCEANDSVLASVAQQTQTQMAAILHNVGYKYLSGADDILGVGQLAGFCGKGATAPNCDVDNLAAIANAVDGFNVLYSSGTGGTPAPTAFLQRLAMFGPTSGYPTSAITLAFPLGNWPGGNTVTNAIAAHSAFVANNLGSYSILPAFGTLGGQQCRYTNLMIAELLGNNGALNTSACAPLPP